MVSIRLIFTGSNRKTRGRQREKGKNRHIPGPRVSLPPRDNEKSLRLVDTFKKGTLTKIKSVIKSRYLRDRCSGAAMLMARKY